jgi:hypothetical protein
MSTFLEASARPGTAPLLNVDLRPEVHRWIVLLFAGWTLTLLCVALNRYLTEYRSCLVLDIICIPFADRNSDRLSLVLH